MTLSMLPYPMGCPLHIALARMVSIIMQLKSRALASCRWLACGVCGTPAAKDHHILVPPMTDAVTAVTVALQSPRISQTPPSFSGSGRRLLPPCLAQSGPGSS